MRARHPPVCQNKSVRSNEAAPSASGTMTQRDTWLSDDASDSHPFSPDSTVKGRNLITTQVARSRPRPAVCKRSDGDAPVSAAIRPWVHQALFLGFDLAALLPALHPPPALRARRHSEAQCVPTSLSQPPSRLLCPFGAASLENTWHEARTRFSAETEPACA